MATSSKPSRTYRGQAAEDRSRERRKKLLAAGLALFGTQGHAATTVRQLCAEAGLTERYFYESFTNRDELFMAVATECVAGLAASIALARGQSVESPEAEMDAILRAFFEWFREDPRRTRIQLFEPLLISPAFQGMYRDVTAVFVGMVREAVTQWFGDKLASRGLDAEILATALVGAAIEVVKAWALTDYVRPIEDVVRNTRFLVAACAESLAR